MKRKKLFILFSLASASSIIAMPLVAGSCDNKNNDNKTEPTPIVSPGPNPGTTPKPSPVTKPGSGKEQPGKEDNNTYSFIYANGGEATNVKYYKNENRILIPKAKEITSEMLDYIFHNLSDKLHHDSNDFTLECPNAISICFKYQSRVGVKKLILPKIKNVIYNELNSPFTMLNEFLEDDKVIQNGILFKWDSASGDIVDDSITSIAGGVFENNQNITSVSFPNVTSIGEEAFALTTNLRSVSFPN
ncbi:leucine-rich repeat protein, partial [Mycoplasma sp. Z407A]|uniref:leucine-rich repeat protein n=1 Tax=Mycoplasma sp. Z407A TaxID=3401678 RepID=UPI003AAECEAB